MDEGDALADAGVCAMTIEDEKRIDPGGPGERPGERLRALAARICATQTMERLIDRLIADLQPGCRTS
jgi:hypothetical protein